MPTSTYVSLGTITLSSTDSEIVFSSIPATYRDLILVANCVGAADENMTPKFNNSSSDFSWVQMTSAPGSSSAANNSIGRISTSRNYVMLQIFDYAQTDKHKTFLVRTEVSGSEVRQLAARWAQTTAINEVSLGIRLGANFAIGSTFSLYGIAS